MWTEKMQLIYGMTTVAFVASYAVSHSDPTDLEAIWLAAEAAAKLAAAELAAAEFCKCPHLHAYKQTERGRFRRL